MLPLDDLLSDLRQRNVELWLDGDNLRFKAPKGALPATLLAELRSRKSEIITFLRQAAQVHASVSSNPDIPTIEPAPAELHIPFPLNEIQQAYWLGRDASFELGNVATHTYNELNCHGLNISRLQQGIQRLVEHHPMLRAIVLPDGRQQILAAAPTYELTVTDLSDLDPASQTQQLLALREELSHQVRPTDQWPLFDISATLLGNDQTRLHLSFDSLIADAASKQIFGQQLFHLYQHPEAALPPLTLTFRDYVLAEQALQTGEWYQQAERYWFDRLDNLPAAPELPLAMHSSQIETPRFHRFSHRLAPQQWQALKKRGQQANLTPSSLLLTAFSEVLSVWSRRSHFTLNLTTFNRLPLHPQVNDIIGDFTALTLLEADLRQSLPFAEQARLLQRQLFEDLDHRQCSGIRVLRELTRRRGYTGEAAMPVVFTSMLGLLPESDAEMSAEMPKDMRQLGEIGYSLNQTPQVWLDHQVFEQQGALIFNWDALEDIFPEGMLEAMFSAYCHRLEQLASDAAAWQAVGREHLLPKEQQQQRRAVNATEVPISDALLHGLFSDQVALRAQHPAIITSERSLTYEQLSQMAQRLAHQLKQQGTQPNTLVAVVLEKGWRQVVAVLGVLMSGAAYVPINPKLPKQRQQQVLSQSKVQWVVATQTWKETFAGLHAAQVLVLDTVLAEPQTPLAPLVWTQQPEDLAYIIYTSGSTGTPKGVAIDHRGAVNTLLDINRRFDVSAENKVFALSALNFDLSVYDIFGLLAAGGTIIMPDSPLVKEPAHWLEMIRQHRVTLWNTVPALAQMLGDYLIGQGLSAPAGLRLAMLSGDWLPLSLPDQLRQLWPEMTVMSLGGATEASIWSIAYPIDTVDPHWTSIPYGKPLANQSFAVLNDRLEPCPVWTPGDLYIGGIGLAQCYWQDEKRTAVSFIHHPVSGERLYKTGDLGRYLPDGNIEFLGREDSQIKLRGFRVELGEIEAILKQHPSVKQSVIHTVGEAPNQQLAAYVVSRSAAVGNTAEAHDPFDLAGVLKDPIERTEFKLAQPGLRQIDEHQQTVPLPKPEINQSLRQAYLDRQSYRQFGSATLSKEALEQALSSLLPLSGAERPAENSSTENSSTENNSVKPLSLESLSHVLSAVMALPIEGVSLPKYRYPSAGNLYPVQLYVRIEKETIANVEAGIYYYHPVKHCLVKQADLPAQPFLQVNGREQVNGRGVTLYLVGQLSAISPLYGELATDFCVLEAGYVSEVLRKAAAESDLSLQPQAASADWALDEQQYLLQTFVLGHQSNQLWKEAPRALETYLYLKPEAVSELAEGLYRYHTSTQTLTPVTSSASVNATLYGGNNQAIFTAGRFSLFLVGNPSTENQKRSVTQSEALLMAGRWGQALMSAAPQYHMGWCPIGNVAEQPLRTALGLSPQQRVLHSFVGGTIDRPHPQQWLAFEKAPTAMTLIDELRQHVRDQLPDYMVPAFFVELDAIPLSANGKVDRKALPLPTDKFTNTTQFVPSRTVEETLLAEVWADVLNVEQVGIYDNFFSLGGDSLLSIQVLTQAKKRGMSFTLRQLFQNSTIESLAKVLGQYEPIVQASETLPFSLIDEAQRQSLPDGVEDAYPLSQLQLGMVFHNRYAPETGVYHNISSYRLSAPLAVKTLKAAIEMITARHPVLRTSLHLSEFETPLQCVHQQVRLQFSVDNLPNLSTIQQKETVATWIEQEKKHPFDYQQAPLIRFHVHQWGPDCFNLTLSVNHAILDGWSGAVLMTELCQQYLSLLGERVSPLLPVPAFTFRDFVAQEQALLNSEAAKQYWQKMLADLSVTKLPRWQTHRDQPAYGAVSNHPIELDSALVTGLQAFAKTAGVSLKSVLLAAHLKVMSALSNQTDVTTGVVSHGRPAVDGSERILGLFLNAIPMRSQLISNSWIELVQQVLEQEKDTSPFQAYPLATLQQTIGKGQPLFEVVFNYISFHVFRRLAETDRLEIESDQRFERTNFPLVVQAGVRPDTNRLALNLQYDPSEFPDEQISAIAQYYPLVLSAMVTQPDANPQQLCLLTPAERQQQLVDWNRTQVDYAQDQCVPQRFEAQVAKTPNAIAATFKDQRLTYRELNERANQLAHYLKARGVRPETFVGLCVERSLTMLIAMLAILKSGAAYVPLDPAFPPERLAFMLADSQLPVLLTQADLAERLPQIKKQTQAEVVCLKADEWMGRGAIASQPTHNLDLPIAPHQLAYIIYTSGSTGTPKGVMIEHRSLTNFLQAMQQAPGLSRDDTLLAVTTISFDIAALELYLPLLAGAKVTIASREVAMDARQLLAMMQHSGVTVMQATPATWRLLLANNDWPSDYTLKILCGGEALPRDLAQQLLATGAEVWNLYGPTETTIWSAVKHIDSAEGPITIGRPLANTQFYILDAYGQPAPVGVLGELHIGGEGLARGYLNRPALTAEKFLPNLFLEENPVSSEHNSRLYKTGDLARYLPTGDIEVLGRSDDQVKLRGFRIELGEIEAILTQHSNIQTAVVVPRELSPGDRQLVAYVVTRSKSMPDNIRPFLTAKLPSYMVPQRFVVLPTLPRTPNGKVDRQALPVPNQDFAELSTLRVAPQTQVEIKLAEIWQKVLKIDHVGIHDSFFDLGGHSLLMAQVQGRLSEAFATDISMVDLFVYPTIHALAQWLRQEKALPTNTLLQVQPAQKRRGRQSAIQHNKQRRQQHRSLQ